MEHPSVLNTILAYSDEYNIEYIRTKPSGHIDAEHLQSLLNSDVVLVSIMSVNNIIGTVQPIQKVTQLLKQYPKAFFHVDASQAIGKMDVNYDGVDAVTLSAHKCYGPKGIGALVLKNKENIQAISYGGGHEFGMRSGTVNIPGIIGMTAAITETLKNMEATLTRLNTYCDDIYSTIHSLKNIRIVNSDVPHILNISYSGVNGEVIVNALGEADVLVSTTSACHSKRSGPNETLRAIGVSSEAIAGSIRISMGIHTTPDDVCALKEALSDTINSLNEVF